MTLVKGSAGRFSTASSNQSLIALVLVSTRAMGSEIKESQQWQKGEAKGATDGEARKRQGTKVDMP